MLFLLLVAPLTQQEGEETEEFNLADLEGQQIEQEFRKRYTGSPWETEEAVPMLNLALDLITNEDQKVTRDRKLMHEARALIQLIIDEDTPKQAV